MSTQEAQQGGTAEQRAASAPAQQESDTAAQPGGPDSAARPAPSEDDLRAAYEAELSRITSADMVLQATVSLLNIGARRLGLLGGPDPVSPQQAGAERDLEQVRDAIDAVRGLMPVVERRAPQEARPLREALSQLQMAYAREAQGAAPAAGAAPAQEPAGAQSAPAGPPAAGGGGGSDAPPAASPAGGTPGGKPGAGPAESSGRLWVPGR